MLGENMIVRPVMLVDIGGLVLISLILYRGFSWRFISTILMFFLYLMFIMIAITDLELRLD